MDYYQMTAPCGLDCFNCTFFLAHEDQEAMNTYYQQNLPKCGLFLNFTFCCS